MRGLTLRRVRASCKRNRSFQIERIERLKGVRMKQNSDVIGVGCLLDVSGSVFLLLCLVLTSGLVVPAFADAPAPVDMGLFYRRNCAGCHGADGAARNSVGEKLNGQDLTDAKWRNETSDTRMVKVILGGKFFGWAMPAYKSQLTKDEAQRLVAEVLRKATKGTAIGPAEQGGSSSAEPSAPPSK